MMNKFNLGFYSYKTLIKAHIIYGKQEPMRIILVCYVARLSFQGVFTLGPFKGSEHGLLDFWPIC